MIGDSENLRGKVEIIVDADFEDPVWYCARGHVSKKEFQREVKRKYDDALSVDAIKHAFMRCTPAGKGASVDTIIRVVERGRGAYMVTYAYV